MSKSKGRKKKKGLIIGLSIISVLPMLLLLIVAFIQLTFRNKIFPNTFIASVYVGDKTEADAAQILNQEISVPDYLVLKSDKQDFKIETSQINLSYNFDKSAKRSYVYSNSGNIPLDIYHKIKLIFKPKNIELSLEYDSNELDEILSIISSEIGTPPQYPSVSLSSGNVVVDSGNNGIDINLEKTKDTLIQKISLKDFSPTQIYFKNIDIQLSQEEVQNMEKRAEKLIGKNITLTFEDKAYDIPKNTVLSFLNYGDTYDDLQIINYIDTLSDLVNRPSQNSVFVVIDDKVTEFTPSKDGVVVDEDKLLELVKDDLAKLEKDEDIGEPIKIPVNITPAKIKNEDVNNLGINSLLGRGVSYFRGSIANRVYNINHAASKFKGILVAPGETFSFDEVLGDVSALTGYKSAYVIKDGKTVLGDGGGVCQVSTTTFRAALNAGLPIVERRAHSYRVGYYEQGFPVGLDATVYYPTTDLKFVNNTPAYILIQSEIDIPHSTLVFEIYGTDDGRVATTSKPIITSSTAPPEDLYIDDPTLPAGQIKQIEYKAWGARVVFDYKVTRGDEVLTQKTFVSNYQPWQAVFLRGTGPIN